MSSHREAPEISKDPVADSTDVYAFVSPDQPDTVTLIANYIPLQGPAGGPNFYEFGDDVLYEIHIDNDGDAKPDVTCQFRFTTRIRNQRTFLYNTGRLTAWTTPTGTVVRPTRSRSCWQDSRRRFSHHGSRARRAISAPGQPRVTSTSPTWPSGRCRRVRRFSRAAGRRLLRGPRFDLRPRRTAAVPEPPPAAAPPAPGVNATAQLNVHTIALQVPITDLTKPAADPPTLRIEGNDRRIYIGQPAEGPRPGD